MARRKRKKPNIPQAALDNARQELDAETSSTSNEPKTDVEAIKVKDEPKATKTDDKPRSRRRRGDIESAKLAKRKNEGTLDADYVSDMLANPTKVVTEDELQVDYAYVIRDLRSMGILAAVLFVALLGIALVVL